MITIYSARDCPSCVQVTDRLRRHGVKFVVDLVSERDVPRLLEAYPQMASPTGLYGLLLPFGVDGDRPIGGALDILRDAAV